MAPDHTRPSSETKAEEAKEARKDHGVDPSAEDESLAPTSVSGDVAAHEKEMAERGANQKGEGRI